MGTSEGVTKMKFWIFPVHCAPTKSNEFGPNGPNRGQNRAKCHLSTYLGRQKAVWSTSFRSEIDMGTSEGVKGSK